MGNSNRLVLLVLGLLLSSGCVALGAAATAFGVVTSGYGVVLKDRGNLIAEDQVEELRLMRESLERAGFVARPLVLPLAEQARERELQTRSVQRPRGFWMRVWEALF